MKRLNLLFKHETIALSPNSFNSDSSSATAILKMVCQGLLKIGPDGQLAPDLATHWAVSPDRRAYRFQLDPAARFHTGRPCDAQAVAWNFERILDGRADSLLRHDYDGLEAVRVLDRHSVEFRLAHPNIAFLHNLAWRTHIVDDTYDQPAGTGPFRLGQWARGSHVLLKRFDGYRVPGQPKADELVIRYAPAAAERIDIIRRGEADIVESVPADAVGELERSGLLHTQAAPSRHRSVVYFNCRQAPFDNPLVRFAVAHAIDRQALVRQAAGPSGQAIDGILDPDDPWAIQVAPIAHDPDRARALLREAGHGGGLRIQVATTRTAPFPAVAQLIQRDLAAVGIELQVAAYDDPPWWPYMYLKGGWQMAIQGTPARPHLDTLLGRELAAAGALNAGGYANPDIDAGMLRARRAVHEPEQRAEYQAIQRIVRDELPFFSLFSSGIWVGWRPGVRGFGAHPSGLIDASNATLD